MSLAHLSLVAAALTADTVAAQATRDSAGIRIVESQRPQWTGAQAERLSATPTVVIGDQPGADYEFGRVVGAARMSDGRIVVADQSTLQLRFFDAAGRFLKAVGGKGQGPGEFADLRSVHARGGDTLAAESQSSVSYFTGAGAFVRSIASAGAALSTPQPGPRVLAGVLDGGARIIGVVPFPAPHAQGARWIESMPMFLVDGGNVVRRDLGPIPFLQMAMDEHPRDQWFGAVAAIASTGSAFFTGLGTEYSIRAYAADGRLERIYRRSWTPVRVTPADIDVYVVEWGKRWIKSTGAAAELERQDLRDDPYAAVVPAFSQLIADRTGRLWVREAHLADAPGAGQLNTMPLVPSVWSVFDTSGRWQEDVTMPARFTPMDIGASYVLGAARDADNVDRVVVFTLGRP